MNLTKILAALMMLLAVNTLNAQIVNDLLKKTTKKTVNKTTESATENASEKASDKLSKFLKNKVKESENNTSTESENTDENTNEQNSSTESDVNPLGNLVNQLSGNGEKINTESVYHFDAYIAYHIKTKKEGEDETNGEMKSYYCANSDDNAFEFEDKNTQQTTVFISDFKNKALLMLSQKDGKKSGFVMPLSEQETTIENLEDENDEQEVESEDVNALQYRKTGRTKKILGYTCDEYVGEDNDSKAEIWTTTQLKFSSNKGLSKLSEMHGVNSGAAYPNGFVMEMHTTGKKDNSKIDMVVTAIDESTSKKISAEGYQLINFNFEQQ